MLPPGRAYVRLEESDESPFAKGFDQFLATELIRRGIFVSPDQGDEVIKVDVQVIRHRSGPPAAPYAFTLLGAFAGVSVFLAEAQPLTLAASAIPPVAAGAGAALDAKRNLLPPATSTEVIVSTALFEHGYQTGGKNDVFYIQTRNAREYESVIGKNISVVGN